MLMGKEGISCVVLVFDRSSTLSQRPGKAKKSGTIQTSRWTHIITGQASVQNYRKYLRISGSKAALCSFVSYYITCTGPERISSENTVILAVVALKMARRSRGFESQVVTVLFSSHCQMQSYRCTGIACVLFKERDVWILRSVHALWTWPKERFVAVCSIAQCHDLCCCGWVYLLVSLLTEVC